MEALESDGHCLKQTEDNDDTLIVSYALDLAVNVPVVVVAGDTDVFVMLIYHFSMDMHDMYFFSEAAVRSKKAMMYISARDVQQKISYTHGVIVTQHLRFLGKVRGQFWNY